MSPLRTHQVKRTGSRDAEEITARPLRFAGDPVFRAQHGRCCRIRYLRDDRHGRGRDCRKTLISGPSLCRQMADVRSLGYQRYGRHAIGSGTRAGNAEKQGNPGFPPVSDLIGRPERDRWLLYPANHLRNALRFGFCHVLYKMEDGCPRSEKSKQGRAIELKAGVAGLSVLRCNMFFSLQCCRHGKDSVLRFKAED